MLLSFSQTNSFYLFFCFSSFIAKHRRKIKVGTHNLVVFFFIFNLLPAAHAIQINAIVIVKHLVCELDQPSFFLALSSFSPKNSMTPINFNSRLIFNLIPFHDTRHSSDSTPNVKKIEIIYGMQEEEERREIN